MRGAYQLWRHSLDAGAAGKFSVVTAVPAAAAVVCWTAVRSRLSQIICLHLHLLWLFEVLWLCKDWHSRSAMCHHN